MPRLRSVGKQAANPLDLAQLRDVTAVAATAAATYVPLTSGNQPNGYGKLDASARLLNAQLPTAIAQTTLASSGKTTAGSLEVTGAADFQSTVHAVGAATFSAGVGVTGAITASGAVSAASVNVGAGSVTAATAAIPEVTSATFKAKATTLDSVSVVGTTNLATTNVTGSLTAQGVSAVSVGTTGDVVAAGEIRGATARSQGSLIVDGASSLQAVTVAGAMGTQAITATGLVRANAGLRLGVGQSLSQVDGSNNNVPVQVAGGIDVNGALTNVTTLSLATLAVSGTADVGGKGTFGDLESQAGLKVAGAVTGVTDLSISGNLDVLGSGKKINAAEVVSAITDAGALTASSLTNPGVSTLAGVLAATATHLTMNGVAIRQNGMRQERYSPINGGQSTWQPNIANSGMARYASGSQNIPNAADTIITVNSTAWSSSTGCVIGYGTDGIYARSTGVYLVYASCTINMLQGRHCAMYINRSGSRLLEASREFQAGYNNGAAGTWFQQTLHTMAPVWATAGDYFQFGVWAKNDSFTTDTVSNTLTKPFLVLIYLGG